MLQNRSDAFAAPWGRYSKGKTDVTDVSPKVNEPDRPRGLSAEDAGRLMEATSNLKRAIDDLAQELATGTLIGRAGSRDRFEIALAEFSAQIDRTAE